MTYLEKNKQEAQKYREFELLEFGVKEMLQATRKETGISLRDIAGIIKKVFKPAEVESLIKELK